MTVLMVSELLLNCCQVHKLEKDFQRPVSGLHNLNKSWEPSGNINYTVLSLMNFFSLFKIILVILIFIFLRLVWAPPKFVIDL